MMGLVEMPSYPPLAEEDWNFYLSFQTPLDYFKSVAEDLRHHRTIRALGLRRRVAPKFSVIFSKNARQSGKDCLRFLDHLTKNFLARYTTWDYAVLP